MLHDRVLLFITYIIRNNKIRGIIIVITAVVKLRTITVSNSNVCMYDNDV